MNNNYSTIDKNQQAILLVIIKDISNYKFEYIRRMEKN